MNYYFFLLIIAMVILNAMTALWLISVKIKDASIVDIFWGFGFVLASWVLQVFVDEISLTQTLTLTLVTVWGLRLTFYLASRNLGKGEDARYQKLRAAGGNKFWLKSLFTVFYLQGFLMLIIGLPVWAVFINFQTSHLLIGDVLASVIVVTGILFESIGDWQLSRFKKDPANKGKVLNTGLWKYTRHPNYFGDFLVWWGFYLFAFNVGAYWTVLGPIVMTLALMKYTGAGLLESTIVDRRPGYKEYIENTSAFFPWFPKK